MTSDVIYQCQGVLKTRIADVAKAIYRVPRLVQLLDTARTVRLSARRVSNRLYQGLPARQLLLETLQQRNMIYCRLHRLSLRHRNKRIGEYYKIILRKIETLSVSLSQYVIYYI